MHIPAGHSDRDNSEWDRELDFIVFGPGSMYLVVMLPKSTVIQWDSSCGFCSHHFARVSSVHFAQGSVLEMANLTSYNVAICLVVALGGFTYGFGFAGFTTSIGQPAFFAYFKLDR
jgi:hypothetical protein